MFSWLPKKSSSRRRKTGKVAASGRKLTPKYKRKAVSKALRQKVLERDDYQCQKCGFKVTQSNQDLISFLHVDHRIPVSKGGLTEFSNLQVLCGKCNLQKSNKQDYGKRLPLYRNWVVLIGTSWLILILFLVIFFVMHR
jgi:5-methylcytosine-specific restriction endonuclease McrA